LVFSGTYDHTVDAKHRLTLPAAFREVLVGRVVVALSPETRPDAKCVEIWTPEGFSAHVEELLAGTNARLPATRELKRVLHSLSWPTELDSANRVMIPAGALTHAGIGTKVTVAGAGDCLEVWDRDRWSAYIGEQLANYSDLLKRVDDTA
jgi:MraZ protein